MISIIRDIVVKERISGLWRGVGPSLARTVPGVGLYFTSVSWLKSCGLEKVLPNGVHSMVVGGVARGFAGTLLIPFTVVKTRIESRQYNYSGVFSAIRNIVKIEGLQGLTAGLGPTLVRDVPYSGLYLLFYDQLKERFGDNTRGQVLAGLVSGMMASLLTHPADVVKTRMQLDFTGKSAVTAVRDIYRQSQGGIPGLAAFYRGLTPRMIRRTLMTALAWSLYERLSTNIGLK